MKSTIKITALTLFAMVTLAGCSRHDALPDGDSSQGEIHLSTAAQAHQTRANGFNPDVQIATSQQVGLHITKADGTPLYTNYAYTADGIGGLALQGGVPTPYYPTDGGNVKISAYHPHTSNSSAYDFVVAANQNVANAAYYGSDLLFSAQREYRRQTTAHQLTFEHLLSKATYTLVSGVGSPNLPDATVEFLDLERAVNFDPTTGNVTTATTSVNGNITPHATYGAIVVPQTVAAGKNLLKVTLTSGAVLYYKTPTGGQEFAQGVKYHFTITVKYNELAMTVETAPWEAVGNVEGDAELGESGGLPFDQAQVGDFYCMDEFSEGYILSKDTTLSDAQKAACIGIVYWVGDATQKDATLAKDHPGCTHGLVVSLGGNTQFAWGGTTVSVQNWLNNNRNGEFLSVATGMGPGDPLNNIQGYNNTKAIEAFNADAANSGNLVTPVQKAVDYRTTVPAPSASSDWYLPSEKELTLLCGTDVDNIWMNHSGSGGGATANRDLINGKLSSIGGTPLLESNYWSSSENDKSYAFSVNFIDGRVSGGHKGSDRSVRFTLAF